MATNETPKAPDTKSAAETPERKSAAERAQEDREKVARQQKSETTARNASGGEVRGQRGETDKDGNVSLADQVREQHEARTTVPGASNVDARLDNRRGADRPKLEEWPAKPQQIDGPDVLTQNQFTRDFLAGKQDEELGERKGMFSPGPHGLSDESLREGGPVGEEQVLYGTESLTEDELKASQDKGPKADG